MRLSRSFVLALCVPCVAVPAWADGLQLLPGGTASVSRGGAIAARPEDPMTMLKNPAGMAFLSGNQLMLEFDGPIDHMCVDPYGYYGWGVYSGSRSEFGNPLALNNPTHPTIGSTYATTPLPKICNSAPLGSIPQLAATFKIGSQLAVGVGFVAPTGVGSLQYGGADGTVQTPSGPRPTPTRYSLVSQKAEFAFDPAVSVAYRVIRQLAFGITFQALMLKDKTTAVQNEVAGTNPATDWFATLEAKDYFIPAMTFSVHARPTEAINLMASFRWIDSFSGSANLTYETNTYQRGATSGPVPYTNPPISIRNVTVPLPWELSVGARYAGRLSDQHDTGLRDPMDTELWDVELDLDYDINSRAGKDSVDVGHTVTVTTKNATGPGGTTSADVSQFAVSGHLKDSVAVRLGGSYAIVPRVLSAQGGAFFETRGLDPAYADIDSFAFERVGLGLGAVIRLGRFDLRAGYSHIFSESLNVAPPPNQPVEAAKATDPRSGFDERVGGTFTGGTRSGGVVLRDPAAPSGSNADAVAAKTQSAAVATTAQPNRVINAGLYTASFDVLSFGATYHF